MEQSGENLEQQIRNMEGECRRVESQLESGLGSPRVDQEAFDELARRYAKLLIELKSLRDRQARGSYHA